MLHKLVDLITSLKLTIACLAAAMVLVLAGTFAQVHFGIHLVQQRYFQSLFVWWPPEGRGLKIPIFPGGYLVGGLLLINLIAAHVRRFQWTWRKLGIHLTHTGLIIMLAGGLFTDLFAVESQVRLTNGEAKNYSEDMRHDELAVIDTTNPEFDQVTATPERLLWRKRIIEHPSFPFQIVVRNCSCGSCQRRHPGLIRHVARFRRARCASNFFVDESNVAGSLAASALLQAVQHHPAEIHA